MSKHERIPQVDAETVFELRDSLSVVLSDVRRHRLLTELSTGDDRQTLDDLAATVVTASAGQRFETEADDVEERVTLALHHCHLPKLADCGLVEYDSDHHEARLTTKGERYVKMFGQIQNA